MGKSPFEKVRSLVERRGLFEALLKEQSEIICKGADDSLFQFKAESIISDSLMKGKMIKIEKIPTEETDIIGNFSVGLEKFFFKTHFKVMGDEGLFHLNSEIFKLQRRSAMRLSVGRSIGIYLAITEFQNKPVYSIAQIADISSGGVRVYFSEMNSPVPTATNSTTPQLRVGDKFKGVLHLTGSKNLNVNCEVKHIQQAVFMGKILDHFGLEFVNLDPTLKNRLLSVTMDLQQKMVATD